MKFSKVHSPQSSKRSRQGFALVVTLLFMVLLVLIALGLLTLSTVSLRTADAGNAQTTARANARMALMLAIGDLQKSAGPDQRVTMTSSLVDGPAPANANWTGAIDVSKVDPATSSKAAPVTWLVSGDSPNPATSLQQATSPTQGNALALGTTGTTRTKLLAPTVLINGATGKGRYAWWIGDEGTKARVDLSRPQVVATTDSEKLSRAQSAMESGMKNLGTDWKDFGPAGPVDKSMIVSMGTSGLAAKVPTVPAQYFDDLTTGGNGLPTNINKGGMKADLTLIFDKSQISKTYSSRYFGATPASLTLNGATMLDFKPGDNTKFFLSDSLSQKGSLPVGPNWGILWNYANQWADPAISSQQASLIGPNPANHTDTHFKNWLPYTNSDLSGGNPANYRTDKQHTNSPLAPVVSLLQVSFRLSSEKVAPAKATDPVMYKAQITMQPVLGLWNPYNVAIKASTYVFDWALYPYCTFNYAKPAAGGKFTDGNFTSLWLRERWNTGAFIPTTDNPTAMSYFSAKTDAIDLQPGEFRLFSATDKTTVTAGTNVVYKLKPGWSETGGFVVNLLDSTGSQRLVPTGYRAWFGAFNLQDIQQPSTAARYPTLDMTKVASTFLSLKSMNPSESILYRATGLWNDMSNTNPLIPEPVITGSDGGLNTTKPTYLIDDLAGDKVLAHIATWSFFSRTTRQAEDVNQRLRGWIDTNPRALVSNPVWDGSRAVSSTHEGWNTSSQFLGVYNPPGKPTQVGDGYGGNRGLLGEGGSEIYEPEVNTAGGRFQGFGGPANTTSGQNRVVIYDVPRTPLVSIGQFQHAQLSRYNFEPGFVVGNSYASVRIPLGSTVNPNFAGVAGLNMVDTSYEVNRRIWDDYYFSTLGLDFKGTGLTSFDKVYDMKKLAGGDTPLPNPRMAFRALPGDTTIDKIVSDSGDRAPEAIAARTTIRGAFNVNSTSKIAWKALLSSMGAAQLPVIDPATAGPLSWDNPEGIRFNRFGPVINKVPYAAGGDGDGANFWQGWRSLSADELDKLSDAIVQEVKKRGPFRSLAEFVNRNPSGPSDDQRRKGALQTAIDLTVNNSLPESVGSAAVKPDGSQFSAAMSGESQAAGGASYLMQGDVLQSLGPVLQARSDYFRIRTCGEAFDGNGKVTARAWCEAFVQRTNDYLDPVDAPYLNASELTSAANKTFGRRFEIVSFRWLSPSEI